ncbi:hypothetical protein P8452_17048 [Trifolium repens]|nr:glycine-rich protein DOT1 [Trifolium repens]WJX28309.1 hypothetical protein P8452_17048 [Trifolium repens]
MFFICALILLSVVAIEPSKDEKQFSTIEESKTKIGLDDWTVWGGWWGSWFGNGGKGNKKGEHGSSVLGSERNDSKRGAQGKVEQNRGKKGKKGKGKEYNGGREDNINFWGGGIGEGSS